MKFACLSILFLLLPNEPTSSFVIDRRKGVTHSRILADARPLFAKTPTQGTPVHNVMTRRVNLSDSKQPLEFNSTMASMILDDLKDMRQAGTPQDEVDAYLNEILRKGPDSSLPLWCKPRFMTSMSKRANLASLQRTLDMTAGPPTENEDDSPETRQRRRRRALVALLRSLSDADKQSSIVSLEQKAASEMRGRLKGDLRQRLPEGLETPKYEVLMKVSNNFEIRRYEAFSTCTVSMDEPNSESSNSQLQKSQVMGAGSFNSLAGYLFGKNQEKEVMKMTTPVLTTQDRKQMSFVMPSNFWEVDALGKAPKPLKNSGVNLERVEGGERAVIMFGGYASKKEVAERKADLMNRVKKSKEWQVKDGEDVVLAQYNDPFTLPWNRLNEVSVSLVPREK
jgi:SOUL heme-binding protein